MNTKKNMSCRIGRHHWEITTVTGMRERICVHCGRNRFDASVHPDFNARKDHGSTFVLGL